MSTDFNGMLDRIQKFRDDRDWMQFHDPKNMAISIILEASELLEHFQWKTKEEVNKYVEENKESVEEEMADIAIYLIEMADNMGIDLIKAMDRKLTINDKKYPVEKSKGKHLKYDKLQ